MYNHGAWSVQAWNDHSTHTHLKSDTIDDQLKHLNLYLGIILFYKDRKLISLKFDFVGVWRSGSAPVLGTGGPRFDPEHPDHLYSCKMAEI